MKTLNEKQRLTILKKCNSGKHKLRTNNFGITWCVNCGLLSTAVADSLTDEDRVLYI